MPPCAMYMLTEPVPLPYSRMARSELVTRLAVVLAIGSPQCDSHPVLLAPNSTQRAGNNFMPTTYVWQARSPCCMPPTLCHSPYCTTLTDPVSIVARLRPV